MEYYNQGQIGQFQEILAVASEPGKLQKQDCASGVMSDSRTCNDRNAVRRY